MEADYNNFRRQLAGKMDELIERLNKNIWETEAEGGVYRGLAFVPCKKAIVCDVAEIEDEVRELRRYVNILMCFHSDKFPSVMEDVEKDGGISIFNNKSKDI